MNKLSLALLVGLSFAGLTSFASAQGSQNAARDAAMHKCINEAHRAFTGDTQDQARSESYKACMAKAGFQP